MTTDLRTITRMTTATPITTPEAARLHLAQVLSPAFPVGGFAWSQGLEWAMDGGVVTRATLPQWLADWLDHGAGWTDAVLVALSLRATDHAALDDLARAACLSSQRLAETVEQGTAFAANIAALTGRQQPAAALAVCPARPAGRDHAQTRSRCQTSPPPAGPAAGVGGPSGCRFWGVSKEGRRAARPGSPLRRRASGHRRAQRDGGLMLVGSTEEAIPC